jgi:galactokinase
MTPDGLVDAFARAWPDVTDRGAVRVVRAPGRVNLIGEHTDYNLGFVLPAAIDRDVWVASAPTDDRRVELVRLDTGERGSMALDESRPVDGTWFDYAAGVAAELGAAGLPVTGLRGVVGSTLPIGAGLSSSAALELTVALALLGDGADAVSRLDLAQIAQRAENDYVGVQCGLMDQVASGCGVAGAALLLDCRSLDLQPVPIPSDLELVVCHTGSSRRLGPEYNRRRAECDAGVAALAAVDPSVASLRDATPARLDTVAASVDPVVLRRCRHVVAENERVLATVAALESGDLAVVGRLFAESHASLRDLFEVSSPELDALVEIGAAVPGVVASRMTGGGFGGCTVHLVERGRAGALADAVAASYASRTGHTAVVMPVRAVDGAARVR